MKGNSKRKFSALGKAAAIGSALLALPLASAHAADGLVNNGGFVNLDVTGTFTTYAAPQAVGGWTIGGDSIDWIHTYWNSADADGYSIDLSGNGAGSMSQPLQTVAGQTYFVQFSMSGNPDGDDGDRSLLVSATGAAGQTYTMSRDQYAPTGLSSPTTRAIAWSDKGYTFVATGQATTLTFTSLNNSAYGPALDNVRVTAVASPGAACKNGGWSTLMNPETGASYKNQGQCVSHFATSGDTPVGP
ncbi:MAG: choice-of-anchor C family protein [Actinomycetales bacterium]